MKKILICFAFAFAFTFASNTEACPYQKMAQVDSKLFSDKSELNTETFAKISNLRVQGAEKLEIGERLRNFGNNLDGTLFEDTDGSFYITTDLGNTYNLKFILQKE